MLYILLEILNLEVMVDFIFPSESEEILFGQDTILLKLQ